MFNCKICLEFNSNSIHGLLRHVFKSHDLSAIEYKIKYENLIVPECICGNKVKLIKLKSKGKNNTEICKGIKISKSCGDLNCIKKIQREKRLLYMKLNPNQTAWRLKNLSFPEKIFQEKLIEMKLNEKHLIIRERSFFPYFIDFAFENEKIAIEIDGSQHNEPKRIESDYKKDNFLIKNNWRVIRFNAKEIINNLNLCIEKLLTFLKSDITFEKIGLIEYKDYKKEKIKLIKEKKDYIKNLSNKKILNIIKLENERKINNGLTNKEIERQKKQRRIIRPDYETLKFKIQRNGYVSTSKEYGVSDNAIRKWIKYYEKYEQK